MTDKTIFFRKYLQISIIFRTFAAEKRYMATTQFIDGLTAVGKQVLPSGASLWLYGSQARGEATSDSDWDLLILLDADKKGVKDFEQYCAPLCNYGFDHDEFVMPQIYTRDEWKSMQFMPFVKNVEHDKMVLV